MKPFFDILDRGVTLVLLILVAAMVVSVSAEIFLNAAVQPVTSKLIQSLSRSSEPAGAATGETASGMVSVLRAILGWVAEVSAPLNTMSQTLLVWIGILGSSLAFRKRAHLGMDALVRYYPYRVRLVLDYFSTGLIAAFSLLVLVLGGYRVCYQAFSMGSKMPGIEELNRGWFYLVLVLAGALNLVYCVDHFLHPQPAGDAGLADEGKENA